MPEDPNLIVRPAASHESAVLLDLIDALADYEHLDPPDDAAKRRLIEDGFERTPPRFETYFVCVDESSRPAGYAIALETYSSFLARPTLYIEDLFILPEARRSGAGTALFRYLAREAHRRGCGRMEWVCLDWNAPAIAFYEKQGGIHLDDWRYYRLTADRLAGPFGHDSGK